MFESVKVRTEHQAHGSAVPGQLSGIHVEIRVFPASRDAMIYTLMKNNNILFLDQFIKMGV